LWELRLGLPGPVGERPSTLELVLGGNAIELRAVPCGQGEREGSKSSGTESAITFFSVPLAVAHLACRESSSTCRKPIPGSMFASSVRIPLSNHEAWSVKPAGGPGDSSHPRLETDVRRLAPRHVCPCPADPSPADPQAGTRNNRPTRNSLGNDAQRFRAGIGRMSKQHISCCAHRSPRPASGDHSLGGATTRFAQ
jgi:hypothetical protein